MKGTDTKTPPSYAPHAVATIYGWTDPRTGEVLVATTKLENPIDLRGVPRREHVFAIHQELRRRGEGATKVEQPTQPETPVIADPAVVETTSEAEVLVVQEVEEKPETQKATPKAPKTTKKTAKKKVPAKKPKETTGEE